jgi:hypothetical protein
MELKINVVGINGKKFLTNGKKWEIYYILAAN